VRVRGEVERNFIRGRFEEIWGFRFLGFIKRRGGR